MQCSLRVGGAAIARLSHSTLLFPALFVCGILVAQSVQPTRPAPGSAGAVHIKLGESIVPLNGPWKFQIGDSPIDPVTHSPLWAEVEYDDTKWETVDLTPRAGISDPFNGDKRFVPGWMAEGHPGYKGWAWYRLHVSVEAEPGEKLALEGPYWVDDCFQVFSNGELVGSYGKFGGPGESPLVYKNPPSMFLLPSTTDGGNAGTGPVMFTLAFRVWMGFRGGPYSGGFHYAPLLGEANAIEAQHKLDWHETILEEMTPGFQGAVLLLLSIVAASLILFDRSDPVYLWIAGVLLSSAFFDAIYTAVSFTHWMDARIVYLGFGIGQPLNFGGWVMVWWVWFRLRRPAWVPWAIAALTLVSMAFGANAVVSAAPVVIRLLIFALLVFIVSKGIRKQGPSGWLVLCAVVPMTAAEFYDEFEALGMPLVWHPFGITIYFIEIADLFFVAVISLLLLQRLLLSLHHQRLMAIDVKQAQEVQRVLIPAVVQQVTGFSIESVYKPAGQVGGDFFQILPTPQGGVLVVIGDVSGKGLPAAMTVSLLVGTLRTLAHYTQSPGEILAAMNKRMLARSRGGFTTCLVLCASPDGALTVANAGHISPYLQGTEIQVENGLPLGLAADSTYAESAFQLAIKYQLTLVTDGVVEARNKRGELFGFERTQFISTQTAESIALAAQEFGQDDDITVLTLSRLAVGEQSSAQQIAPALSPSPA